MLFERLDRLSTEQRNMETMRIDLVSTMDLVETMNEQNQLVIQAIYDEKEKITSMIDHAVACYLQGGKILYVGSGMSGKLGLMAAEQYNQAFSTHTFSVVMPGVAQPLEQVEDNVEDNPANGETDIRSVDISNRDFVLGISASGRTPYVIGALRYAQQIGAVTSCICCNRETALSGMVDYPVEVDCGPEIFLGATQLKASSAQKSILNMLCSALMIRSGRTYTNLVVDLQPLNEKMADRARRTVMQAANVDYTAASNILELCEYDCKLAIIMLKKKCTLERANALLAEANGFLRKALDM